MERDFVHSEPILKRSPVGKVDPETGEVFEDLENADDEVRRPVVVTDEMRKEDFLICLGLITKKALSELQNKKTVRKRRTTANPHFSNAAIEAKRINQMEMAARKAKRKEQTRTRYSLVCRSSRIVPDERPHHKSVAPVPHRPVSQSSQSSPYHKLLSNTCRDCAVCKELCEPDVDMIIFCLSCPCLFHATCATTVQEFASTGFFNCPQCDRKKTLADEVTDFTGQSHESPANSGLNHQTASAQPGKHKRRGYRAAESPKYGNGQEMITLNQGNNVVSRVSFRSHYDEKRAELSMLMEKKEILELEWTKRKEMYNDTVSAFSVTQQKVAALELAGKKIENDVNRLVGFIRSVKIWTEIIDPDEDQPVPHKAIPAKDPSCGAAPALTASTTMTTTMTTCFSNSPSISITTVKTEPEDRVMDETGDAVFRIDNNNHMDAGISPKSEKSVLQNQNRNSSNHNSSSETNGIGSSSPISELIAAVQQ